MVFAEDIVLSGETSHSNADNIKHIHNFFISGAGQKINPTKSLILTLDNTDANIRHIFLGF